MTDSSQLMTRALGAIDDLERRLAESERARHEPIAVVGLSCRFPGAPSVEELWKLLDSGSAAVGEAPANRWTELHPPVYPDPSGIEPHRLAGYLEEIDRFDPSFFGISPREATSLDPQHRLLLEGSWHALEHAGIPPASLIESRTGVFVGITTSDYSQWTQGPDEDLYVGTGAALNSASGRISFTLGLQGPAVAMDTACSSSLVATHLAGLSLRAGGSDVALAAGVNAILSSLPFERSRAWGVLAADGRCKTFDASADGFVRGEGCGVLVLKRLSDALADRDRILALIRGTAVNQDGRSSGLSVPNGLAQQKVYQAALDDAGIHGSEVGYIEAHGTGTALGDPIEVEALGAVYGPGRGADFPLRIGSIKTNIGHLESASGVAGLSKAILSLHRERIPPHLNFETPNPDIPWDDYPIEVATESVEWPRSDLPRYVGVSAFGFTGTNAHMVLGEAPASNSQASRSPTPESSLPVVVFPLSAKSTSALPSYGSAIREAVNRMAAGADDLEAHAAEAATGRNHLSHRAAVVAASAEELAKGLERISNSDPAIFRSRGVRPRIAFLFSGQGAQTPGMGRELYETSSVAREALDLCASWAKGKLPVPLLDAMFGDDAERLRDTRVTQPALFALEFALARFWMSLGVQPEAVAGHSLGEYTAACIAGAMDPETAFELVLERGRLMSELPSGGAMAALFAELDVVEGAVASVADSVSIAGLNSPGSVVISGAEEGVEAVCSSLAEQGVEHRRLEVSHAFHSPLMDPVSGPFETVAERVAYRPTTLPIAQNQTGALLEPGAVLDAEYWRKHLRGAVRFMDCMRALREAGCDTFVEIGPKSTLLGLGARTIPDADVRWIPSFGKTGEWRNLMDGVRALYEAGCDVEWEALYSTSRDARPSLPTYPFQRKPFWVDIRKSGFWAPSARVPGGERVHPLLGRRISSAGRETLFECDVDPKRHAFLDDHRVGGAVIVPAAAYMEMGWAAAQQVDRSLNRLEGGWFLMPLAATSSSEREVQLVVSPSAGEGGTTFEVASRAQDDDAGGSEEWVRHGGGTFRRSDRSAVQSPSELWEQRLARCTASVDPESYYEDLETLGLAYGPTFRTLVEIRVGEREALGRLRLPDGEDANSLSVHPGILDGTFHLIGAALGELGAIEEDRFFLPMGFDSAERFHSASSEVRAHVRLRDGSDPSSLSADVWIEREDGTPVARIDGLQVRETSGDRVRAIVGAMLTPEIGEELDLTWEPMDEPDSSDRAIPAEPGGPWTIVGASEEAGRRLAARFAERGVQAMWMSAEEFEPTEELVGGVLDLRLFPIADFDPRESSPISDRIASGPIGAFLELLKAVSDRPAERMPTVVVVTSRAQAVTAGEPVNPFGTAAWGLGTTAEAELAHLPIRMIDLEREDEDTLLRDADRLIDLLLGPGGRDHGVTESRIAFRGGNPWVARLAPTRGARSEASSMPLRTDGSYLITGGLGALGLRIARDLAARGAGRLILLGRSRPNEAARAAITELQAAGATVQAVQGDVTRIEDLRRVLQESGEGALRGVIHAAGVIEDRVLHRLDAEALGKVLRPKVDGLHALEVATEGMELDFFVAFSSASAVMGSAGQGAYSIANGFMDGFAHWRRASGRPGTTVNWGAWAESGMATDLDDVTRRRWEELGIEMIDPDAGVDRFAEILSEDVTQRIVLPVRWDRFFKGRRAAEVPGLLRGLWRRSNTNDSGSGDSSSSSANAGESFDAVPSPDFSSVAPDDVAGAMLEYLSKNLAVVLRVEPDDLVPTSSITDLGIDSLTALEIKNRIESGTGLTVSIVGLLEGPTLIELTEDLTVQVQARAMRPVPDVDETSDVEVEHFEF